MRKVVETMVRAFLDDRMMCYFFPDPAARLRSLPKLFNFRVRNCLNQGSIFATSENIEGVVIITHSEQKKRSSWLRAIVTGGIGLYRMAGSECVRRMREVESFVFSKRAECIFESHMYLGSLAVHPDYQGKGLAGRLIRSVLEMCSSQDELCVLDTQDEGLVQMYRHFGFAVVDSYSLPEANIPHWIMAKRP